MKIKKDKNFKLILFGTVTLIMFIVVVIIIYNFNMKNDNEMIPAKDLTSNMGTTSEEKANTWDTSKLSEIIVDTSMVDSETGETITMYVPIPAGYTASKATSEDTVIEGLVIYEGTDEVNDSNVAEAKTTRNQYVWIPVNPEDVYWTDDDGKNWGIEYNFSDSGIKAISTPKREPIIREISSYNYQDYYLDYYKSDINTELNLEADMENMFNSMVESIEQYGGFFIGRYEVGDETAISRDSNSGTTANAVEVQGKYVYNYITWFDAYSISKQFSNSNENVSTSLIWGTTWDNTLKFLVETENKTYEELTTTNSSSWGNYNGTEFNYVKIGETSITTKNSGSSVLIPTGSTEYTKACNIYDLAGNVSEWSMENHANSFNNRTGRGGAYNTSSSSSSYSASSRTVLSWNFNAGVGFRTVMWIS